MYVAKQVQYVPRAPVLVPGRADFEPAHPKQERGHPLKMCITSMIFCRCCRRRVRAKTRRCRCSSARPGSNRTPVPRPWERGRVRARAPTIVGAVGARRWRRHSDRGRWPLSEGAFERVRRVFARARDYSKQFSRVHQVWGRGAGGSKGWARFCYLLVSQPLLCICTGVAGLIINGQRLAQRTPRKRVSG